MGDMDKKRLVLIDGHSVVFRAFYAIPYLTSPAGEMVNAVYGFALILLNVITDLAPTYLAVTFDTDKPTFRHTGFAAYKAQRKAAPEELISQLGKVHEVVKVLNMPVFEVEGFEADDVIGTLAKQASDQNAKYQSASWRTNTKNNESSLEIVIVTGDQDQFQLVKDPLVKVYMPPRGKQKAMIYEEEDVLRKMGVRVDQITDYKGLAGDSSDNIPGIKGIGPKTTVGILREFGSIDNFYAYVFDALGIGSEIPNSKFQIPNNIQIQISKFEIEKQSRFKKAGVSDSVMKKMLEGYEMAIMSRDLATIDTNVPIKLDLPACELCDYDKEKVLKLFNELGFKSLIGKLPADQFEADVQESLF